ncbi:hypothetical protein ACFLU5_06420 [Bacteroidota bacterium]
MKTALLFATMILVLWACSGKTGSESSETQIDEPSATESVEAEMEDPVTSQMAKEAENLIEESEKLEQKADSILNSI